VHAYLVRALGEISVFETIKGEQTRTMLDNAFKNHRSLLDRHAAASGSALRIDQGTRKITASIAEIVMSLQFHDITRQTVVTDRLVERLRDLITSLHDINKAIRTMLSELCDLGGSLVRDTEDAATHTAVHREIETALNGVRQTLAGIIDNARKRNPGALLEASSPFFAAIDRLYTMESERAIHLRHLEASSGSRD